MPPLRGFRLVYNDEGSAWEHTTWEAPPRKAGGAWPVENVVLTDPNHAHQRYVFSVVLWSQQHDAIYDVTGQPILRGLNIEYRARSDEG